jgi:hypothetical protein
MVDLADLADRVVKLAVEVMVVQEVLVVLVRL